MKILQTGTAIVKRDDSGDSVDRAGSWLRPMMTRKRKGLFVGPYQPSTATAGSSSYYATPDRFLTNDELWEVYRRTPDVRAAIDSIVRRVATFDWFVEPVVDPSSDDYEAAASAAETARRFLSAPSRDGDTWQEVFTSLLTDLLVYDAAALELVHNSDGELVEVNPLRGSSIEPKINEHGRVLHYEQSLYSAVSGTGFQVDGAYHGQRESDEDEIHAVTFKPDELIYLRLFPSTSTPFGNPLIEALINEVISMLRASEHTMLALDADEIPPGILVLAGLAGQAAREATADLQRLRGQDHKVRVLTTPDPSGIGARWVELRHTPKDLSFVEVVDQIRKTCWRVFGVLPVEMGATAGVNRATAEVQVDVASSHLVTPILELLQAKINSRLLPLVVGDPDLAPLVQFKFDREARLSPEQSNVIASRHQTYVASGVMTRNEVRSELGLMPIAGGDVPTVTTGAGPVPLTMIVPTDDDPTTDLPPDDEPPPDDPEPEPEPEPEPDPSETEGVEDPDAAAPSEGDEAPGEVEADADLNRAKIDDLSKELQKIIRKRARDHNKEVNNAKSKRTTPNVLAEVYDRGVGAYYGNPESVRPSVSSAQQWGLGRVDSFLYALRNGRYRRGKHDTDLLPKGHPMSTKGKDEKNEPIGTIERAVVELARLPVADLQEPWGWDGGASDRVLGDPPNWDRYERAHLWRDPSRSQSKSGYKFPVAKMVDDKLTLVFRGVAGIIGALKEDGKHESLDGVSIDEQREIYRIVRRLYRRFDQEPPVIDRLEDDRSLLDAVERAVGDVDPTNFPASGDDLKVSLRNSQYEVFDPDYAERLKYEYPEIWGRGGNILGNKQYRRLRPVVARGGVVETETEEEAVRLREAWSARHFKDYRLAGVVAQIKWFTVGTLGERGMKDVIEAEIERLSDDRAVPWVDFISSAPEDRCCHIGYHHEHSEKCSHITPRMAFSPDQDERDEFIERASMLPSEWLRGGLFDKVRTLDLQDLGTDVSVYIREVTDVWRAARNESVAAVKAAARSVGDREAALTKAKQALGNALEKTAIEWAAVTAPMYERAALIGNAGATKYAGIEPEGAEEYARAYAMEQIGYLTANDGLLADVRLRTIAALTLLEDSDERADVQIPTIDDDLPAGAAPVGSKAKRTAMAVALAEAAWDANEHRIASYGGRLVEVSNSTFVLGLEKAGTAVGGTPSNPDTAGGPTQATQWYAEWAATLDSRTCPECEFEGSQGIRPLSQIQIRPGGATTCGGRCRCVLVVWTEQEVKSGEALKVGPF